MSTRATCIIYLIGYLVAAPLIYSMWLGYSAREWPTVSKPRQEAGQAVLVAVTGGILWPATLPIIFCLTGFAEHGLKWTWEKEKAGG